METGIQTQQTTVKSLLAQKAYKDRFEEIMGKKAQGFISSVINVSASAELALCEPRSVIMSAVVAATLDLPIDRNLGFAYIIGYKDKDKGSVAQFQIGYKGFVQLAMRTGQYQRLTANIVYDGQIISANPFTDDYEFNFAGKKSDKAIGYVAYFRLLNGFEKYLYMTTEQIEKHAKKYSQTYKRGFGKWAEEFDSMALKTVIKLLISKFGILSIQMQEAIKTDQAEIVKADSEGIEVKYPDADNAEFTIIEPDKPAIDLSKLKTEKDIHLAFAKGDITDQQRFDLILKLEENGAKK